VTAGAVGSVWGEGRRLPRGLWPKGSRCREGRVPVRGGNRRHCTRRPETWREQIAVQIARGGGDGGTGGSGPSDGDTEGRQRAAPSNSKGEGRGKRSTCRRVRGSGGAGPRGTRVLSDGKQRRRRRPRSCGERGPVVGEGGAKRRCHPTLRACVRPSPGPCTKGARHGAATDSTHPNRMRRAWKEGGL